ncbi:MAG TPA: lactate racemase domain-containing protein [Thermodesulfobacteriota bacterium]|nr:lactate racemase domain-containing protein [Thermodesulfobacteriota bacterium]
MEKSYYLHLSSDKKEYFALPERWKPLHFVETQEGTPPPSIEQMTREALSKSTGPLLLQQLLSRAKRIAILIDDATRPTPVAKILGVLLDHLSGSGISRENITIVAAIGTHETMEKDVLKGRLGGDVLSRYKVVQHNARQGDLVPVQIPEDGRVVKINSAVAEANLRIAISSVLPHPMAGYGGGPKILMPGVCNYEFIRDHHMTHVSHPQSVAGVTKGNPFHEDCMKVARAIGLDFSINCVYNQKGQAIRIIAGGLETAFEKAVSLCFEKLGCKFDEKVDVTITSTYPHTHGHQFVKGLSTPDVITKSTGAILLVAPTVGPLSAEFLGFFDMLKEKSNNNTAAYVKESLSRGEAFLPGKAIDFNMAMATVFLRPKIRVILVSPHISRQEAETMGLEHSSSIEEGVKSLGKLYPDAKVAIFPAGGLIVPITSWKR